MNQGLRDNNRASLDQPSKRCIWMTAGVVSYKLCPLQFECDNCEFDAAMRQKDRPTDPPQSCPPATS